MILKNSFFLILFIFSSTVFAKEVRVGLFGLIPYAYEEDGKTSGILYDFLNEVDKELKNLKFSYRIYPYNRLLEELKSGSVDLALFYSNEKAGTAKYQYHESLGNVNYVVGINRFDPKNKNFKIGVIGAASYGDEIDSLDEKRKISLKDYAQGIRMLEYLRLTHLVMPSTGKNHYCQNDKIRCPDKFFKNSIKINEKNNWLHLGDNLSSKEKELIKKAHDKVIKRMNLKYLHDLLK